MIDLLVGYIALSVYRLQQQQQLFYKIASIALGITRVVYMSWVIRWKVITSACFHSSTLSLNTVQCFMVRQSSVAQWNGRVVITVSHRRRHVKTIEGNQE